MSKEYPLFPELTDDGKEQAVLLVHRFKEELKKAADEVISDLYVGIIPHIESDSWTNFRNDMLNGFVDYKNQHLQCAYDFKKIRQKIYEEYREDIIADLNKDILEENEGLKKKIARLNEIRNF